MFRTLQMFEINWARLIMLSKMMPSVFWTVQREIHFTDLKMYKWLNYILNFLENIPKVILRCTKAAIIGPPHLLQQSDRQNLHLKCILSVTRFRKQAQQIRQIILSDWDFLRGDLKEIFQYPPIFYYKRDLWRLWDACKPLGTAAASYNRRNLQISRQGRCIKINIHNCHTGNNSHLRSEDTGFVDQSIRGGNRLNKWLQRDWWDF